MGALVQAFFQILLLRAGPQSVPASTTLMWLVLAVDFSSGVLLTVLHRPLGFSIAYALVGTLTMVAVVHGLLSLARKPQRFLQTLTALAACDVMLGLMWMPLLLADFYFHDNTELQGLLAIASLALIVWGVAVVAHIFRHALSVSTALGFLYSVIYYIISLLVSDMMAAAGATG